MHPNAAVLDKLFNCLNVKDHQGMADCYAPDASFADIAFALSGRKQIQAMWHMISKTDLSATFAVVNADEQTGEVEVTDDYRFSDTGRRVRNPIRSRFRFRDGLVVEQQDSCNALSWGVQALGPVRGVLSWVFPEKRKAMAMAKLAAFIKGHPEYAGSS